MFFSRQLPCNSRINILSSSYKNISYNSCFDTTQLSPRDTQTPPAPPSNCQQMKIQNLLRWISLTLPIFIILINQSQSHATQPQPILDNLTIDSFINKTLQWKSRLITFQGNKLKLSASTLLAGVFCFIAASISSAGGIGGGGLFIPILIFVAGLDLKTASSFSAFMVTGGSIANVMYNLRTKSAKFGGKTLIDYDIALLSEPCMLLGVSVGVVCNLVLPEWLITILFAIFLVWSTFKTCKNEVKFWKME